MKTAFRAVMMGLFGFFIAGLSPVSAQENLGKVEIACSEVNTGNGYAMKIARIERAYGACSAPHTNYYAGVSFVASNGSNYVVDIWFSRNPSVRGYSAINSLAMYQIDREYTQSRGAVLDGLQCGTMLVADNRYFVQLSTLATRSGISYPESFACSVKIIPGRI